MNSIEIIPHRPGDIKLHSRADIHCKWTPFSLQGEHFITTIFWEPDQSSSQVRLRVTENLLAIIFIPITVQTEEFANPFLALKISGTLDMRENQNLEDFWTIWTRIMGDLKRSHTSISCTLLLIYKTFELNIKCLWQHRATSNNVEITKIEWSEIFDPIVITAHSLRQLQPGNWKIAIKPGTEELTNLLPAQQKLNKFPHFKNTHPLSRHLVKELIRQYQFSVSDEQATSPKRNKTNYN